MDITSWGVAGVAIITVLCYFAGMVVKVSGLNDKWIPVVCGGCGLILGIAAMFLMPDFPAADYITAAAIGTVSGLAATGADQIKKQLSKE